MTQGPLSAQIPATFRALIVGSARPRGAASNLIGSWVVSARAPVGGTIRCASATVTPINQGGMLASPQDLC